MPLTKPLWVSLRPSGLGNTHPSQFVADVNVMVIEATTMGRETAKDIDFVPEMDASVLTSPAMSLDHF